VSEPDYAADRAAAVQWARDLLARQDWCILDSETTGLGIWSEVVQLAIIDPTGAPLLDTLIKPVREIESGASAIHGITSERVADAPSFMEVYNLLCSALRGRAVVVYNADFDTRMLFQTLHLAFNVNKVDDPLHLVPRESDGERTRFGAEAWECAMLQYAAYVGDWSDYHGNYRYQKLPGGDHSALGDARATLRLVQRMAGVCNASITVPVMDVELSGYDMHFGRFYVDGSFGEFKETRLADALSAFVAELVDSYSGRASNPDRHRLALAWFNAWRREQGWRPIFERQNDAPPDRQP
jgi:DNA polymerase III subunit epsilon